MKWQIKFLSLILAAILVFGLAACGNNGGADTADTPAVQTPASETTNKPAEETPVEEISVARYPIKDMGGRDFKWLCWWDLNATPPDMEEPDPEEEDNYEVAMMVWENAMNVYRDYNATVSNVTTGFEETIELLTTSVMAGAPAGDLVMMNGYWIINAVIGNLLIPFEEILPADHDFFTTRDHAFPTSNLLGKTWTASRRDVLTDGNFLGVNLDIIRAIGAENPAELYDRGEWTVDKFIEIARLATRDTTGDGNIDQWGIAGQSNDILLGLLGANDAVMVTEDLQYGFDHPHTMRVLEAAYQIFNVDKSWNFDPLSGAEFWNWQRNTHAFKEGRSCFFNAWIYLLPDLEDRTFDYTGVPYPKGPDNKGDYAYISSFTQGVGIPRGIQNPEDVFTIWYELGRWYGDDFELKDEEDLEWPYSKFNTLKDGQRIMNALEKGRKIDVGESIFVDGVGYTWLLGSLCEVFYNDTGTPAQAVEENRQLRQDMLDQVFGALVQ